MIDTSSETPATLRGALGEDISQVAARLTPAQLAARVHLERVMAHSALDSAALNAAAIGVHLEGLRLAYPEIADDLDEILEIAKSIVEDVDGIISNLPEGK